MAAYVILCGCCIPSSTTLPSQARKGLPPLRSQGSPLHSDPFLRCRCGMGTPLTSFTPLYKSTYRAFSGSPLFLFFFCFIPRSPRHGLPETPFAFLLSWRTFPESWRGRFCQALSADEAGTRRAWGLRECVEPAKLSTCQPRKKVALGFFRKPAQIADLRPSQQLPS
jgi:hypothetical protein